ncbi:MAG TPA: peptide synthetase [Myxococcales bacterium]|nr:peptide synthetase [Deltaproteobacteria bacterium]MBU47424.1 peptide synthetase [Deltaproteobacteria bacterium]HAA54214.1 peptide synthetase [Myxococcales bacterium]
MECANWLIHSIYQNSISFSWNDETKITNMNTQLPQQSNLPLSTYDEEHLVLPSQGEEKRSILSYAPETDPILWERGERLDHLFEARCQQFEEQGRGDHIALQFDGFSISYTELNRRANQLAHFLQKQGIQPGDRVGHIFNKTPETYVSLLAIMKAGATFLPFDLSTPEERLRFIIGDGELKAILSMSSYATKFASLDVDMYLLDDLADQIQAESEAPIEHGDNPPAEDSIAYIIYTSGTTGHPKGVAINHSSICNFVRVAAKVYGYKETDRIYQGMTLAFDFSFEEVFVPMIAGSTLVPSPGGLMLGCDLWEFLDKMKVTAMCCVPTLLASINEDLDDLRLILLGGEATPQDLVARWDRPDRIILNTYGPTEATITATAGPMYADEAVTIGKPLPTYSIAIIDPDEPTLTPFGELGEICIAGIGLAVGYLNLEEKTQEKFIPDFLDLPNNPSKRIYRTGDLGRITENGEVEFLGRIDTQVKLRGYRIELTEIESVLLEHDAIAQAVVDAIEVEPNHKELVAYYTLKQDVDHEDRVVDLDRGEVFSMLSQRLPKYMVPAYMEHLEEIPMLPSNKVNRKVLPKPTGSRLVAVVENVRAPETALEGILVEAFKDALQLPEVSTDAHFFEELGANSLGLARFSSTVRQAHPEFTLSIRDCYQHPSILDLAAHLEAQPKHTAPKKEVAEQFVPSRFSYVMTGVMQYAFGTLMGYGMFWLVIEVALWLLAVYGTTALYVRAMIFGVAFMAASAVVSVSAKWLLIGRYKAEQIPLWGLRYFRFWIAKQFIGLNPLVAFKGTPVYNLYLNMLGADVSLSAVIESKSVPFCTDLLKIGPNTVLRKDVLMTGYKVENNIMTLGPIEIGEGVFVGEGSVIDINTKLEDNAQLGHSSSVQEGQVLEANKQYHGSPAIETDTQYAQLDNEGSVVLRGFLYAAILSLPALLLLPLSLFIAINVVEYFSLVHPIIAYIEAFSVAPLHMMPSFMAITSSLYILGIAVAMVAILIWPRLYNMILKPGKTYRLYGLRYFFFRTVRGLSNSKFLNTLFGDSSLITMYLQAIGYNLNQVIQTGSNFGTSQKHDTPFLCEIGTGTMVSDGLSMININQSATSFRLKHTALEEECFLGNDIRVPPESKIGRNCLLATKVLVPIDGKVREDVGLLGSPAFEIPRIVERDLDLLAQYTPEEKAQNLRKKNMSNLLTASLYLFSNWLYITVAITLTIFSFYAFFTGGFLLWLGVATSALIYTILHFTIAERISIGFGRLATGMFSIYDPRFWSIERYWKLSSTPLPSMFKGTPLRGILWRLLGVRVGRMLFDDGAIITERTLVSIGDHCNLNEGVSLQSHSLEDGAFKCEPIDIGNGCNLMPGSFVHYGVDMQDRVVLEPDSFLMKGERPEEASVWQGNPAQKL